MVPNPVSKQTRPFKDGAAGLFIRWRNLFLTLSMENIKDNIQEHEYAFPASQESGKVAKILLIVADVIPFTGPGMFKHDLTSCLT
jgi:hypothetical protein